MPKYLGIDFLSQVLRQKEHLLTRMLISCHGDGCDDKEGIPISCKTDKPFLWYFSKAQFEKFPKKDAGSYLLEILPSTPFGRKPERYHKHSSCEIEYVPSSNPDSPPPSFLSDSYLDLEEEIVKDVCDYFSRHEIDINKYDSLYTSNTVPEEWQMEEILMKDCFEDFLRRMPRFQDLASRLKPRKVADPFIGDDGCLRNECWATRFRMYCDQNSSNKCSYETKETFVKLLIPEAEQNENEDYKFTSPLTVSHYRSDSISYFKDNYGNVNCEIDSPTSERSCGDKYFYELENAWNDVAWRTHQKYMNDGEYCEKAKVKSFLELNGTEAPVEVKDVSKVVLESPQQNYLTEHEDNVNKQDLNQGEPCQLKQEQAVFVSSPPSENKMTRAIVASSRLRDKISLLTLVVPDVEIKELTHEDLAHRLSTLRKEEFQSELELQLHWDPLHKSPEKNICLRHKTIDNNYSSSDSPLQLPIFGLEVKLEEKKLPWSNVYVSSNDASPLTLEITREIKSSPLVPCVKVKENVCEINTCFKNDRTRNKPTGKRIMENLTACSTSTGCSTSKMSDASKKCTNIHSGINDFVLLRTGVKSSSCPPRAIVKAMKVDEGVADQHDVTLNKTRDLKAFTEVVNVRLDGELQATYSYIENFIRPRFTQLQEAGCIAFSFSTSNLTAEYTRFALKQEEKNKSDLIQSDQACDSKKYEMLLGLHTLVTTAELVKECGITVARDYVKNVAIQRNQEFEYSLDRIKSNLMKAEQNMIEAKAFHPKIIATYNYVQTWQPKPSLMSLNYKILVVIFKGFENTSTCLMNQLRKLQGLKITTMERRSQICPVINNAHVVICDPSDIPDNFPWSLFVSFILYEDKQEWLNKMLLGKLVKVNNIICFKGVSSGGGQERREYNTEESPVYDPETAKQAIYTLIGSSKITKNIDLLRHLEQRCGIVIIEREYERILRNALTTSSKMCRQPDLLLDQHASVIIENVINFGSEDGYMSIVDLVLSTSFKCQMCSIILVCEGNRNSGYSFVGNVQLNLAKFHGCLMSIQQSFPHFVVDVFYSQSVKHTASLIRRLCEVTRDSSQVFTKQDWARRNWLAEECSENEKFLLGFPSLNSFSAQLMLNVLPLTKLLTASFESLKKALPWISERILKNFKETTECGLHVEDEKNQIEIPQFAHNETFESANYCFNPVIENMADDDSYNEDSAFELTDIPSNSLNANLAHCQKLNNTPNVLLWMERHQQRHLQEYSVGSARGEVSGDISVTDENSNHTLLCGGYKERQKRLLGYSKSGLKRGHNMTDVVGIVQPKPRGLPISDSRESVSNISQPPVGPNMRNCLRRTKTILPSHQLYHSIYNKPQKKKKKLTYEIVPGAKNGQTRLTFV